MKHPTNSIVTEIISIGEERDWGIGADSGIITHGGKAGLYVNIGRLGIKKYQKQHELLVQSGANGLIKLSYFKDKYGDAEVLNNTRYSIVEIDIRTYLDECMMNIFRKELDVVKYCNYEFRFYTTISTYSETTSDINIQKTLKKYYLNELYYGLQK